MIRVTLQDTITGKRYTNVSDDSPVVAVQKARRLAAKQAGLPSRLSNDELRLRFKLIKREQV